MRRLIIILGLMLFSAPCFAGGIGYINYEKVAANYFFAKNSLKEIETKAREIEQFLITKESEFKKIESPLQKQKFEESVRAEMKKKEDAFNSLREKREEEVYTRIHAVAEKIRLEKQLDILLDAKGVFSGGIDITNELITKLNQNAR